MRESQSFELKRPEFKWIMILMAIAVGFLAIETLRASDTSDQNACSGIGHLGALGSQVSSHCKDYKALIEGKDVNVNVSKTWGAVSVVCTAACVAPAMLNSAGCQKAMKMGNVADNIQLRRFTNALHELKSDTNDQKKKGADAGNGDDAPSQSTDGSPTSASNGTSTSQNPGDPTVGADTNSSVPNACKNAGKAYFTTASNSFYAKEDEKKSKSVLTEIDRFKSKTASVASPTSSSDNEISAAASAGAIGSAPAQNNGKTDPAAAPVEAQAESLCAKASRTKNVSDVIGCATTHDKNLPTWVNSQQFAKDFEKATGGLKLTDFFSKEELTTEAVSGALQGVLDQPHLSKLTSLLKEADKYLENGGLAVEGSAYASTEAPAQPGSAAENEPDFGKIMEGLMNQLSAKDENTQEPKSNGVLAVAFANRSRAPASIAEDPKLSIFDRVTYRYLFVAKQQFSILGAPSEGAGK